MDEGNESKGGGEGIGYKHELDRTQLEKRRKEDKKKVKSVFLLR